MPPKPQQPRDKLRNLKFLPAGKMGNHPAPSLRRQPPCLTARNVPLAPSLPSVPPPLSELPPPPAPSLHLETPPPLTSPLIAPDLHHLPPVPNLRIPVAPTSHTPTWG